jgi:hypothetical protein
VSGQVLHAKCECGFEMEILEGLQADGAYHLPAVCEECRHFLVADYRNPKCPGCGKRPIFFGEMAHKFRDFVLYNEKKHVPAKKTGYRVKAYLEETLASPMSGDPYCCAACGQKRLRFSYDGFWK